MNNDFIIIRRLRLQHNFKCLTTLNQKIFLLLINKLFYVIIINFLIYTNNCFAEKMPFLNVVTELYPPYQYIDKNRQLSGLSVDIIKEVLNHANIQYKFEVLPWSRAYFRALNNTNTLIFSMTKLPARENDFLWGNILVDAEEYFIWRKKSLNPKIFNISELNQYTIISSRSSAPAHYLEKIEHKKLHLVNDLTTSVKMVIKGRGDLFIATLKDVERLELNIQEAVTKVINIKPIGKPLYYAFNRNTNKKLISKINRSFQKLTEKFIFTNKATNEFVIIN